MECRICQNDARYIKTLPVRGTHQAKYYLCDFCGFMFVGNPNWLAEAYGEPINVSDTGYVLRNVYLSRKTLVLFYFLFDTKEFFLDFAGGYGMLSRLMRDYGLNFLNTDKYTPNLFMKGFEYSGQPIKALTCFECFEHLSEPAKEIDEIFKISPNIFFSTVLFDGKTAPPNEWEYYGLQHGQHIAFYSMRTLQYLAKKHNVHFCSDGKNLHLFTKKKIPQWYFRFLLSLTTFQVDVFIRKVLESKTVSDSIVVQNQN